MDTSAVAADLTEAPPAAHEWRRWAAHALLNGSELAEVIDTLTNSGMPEGEAAAVCAKTLSDPVFEAALLVSHQHRKLSSMLTASSAMLDLSESSREVPRVSGLTRDEFLDEFYALNRPVLLDDVADTWPALTRWTPEYLSDRLRGQEVEVMAGRESDPDYEVNAASHRKRLPFEEYVQTVMSAQGSNDVYLVANNHLLESPAAAPLWEDFELDTRYMNPHHASGRTFFWFGPGGTITPLHHDIMNVLFHQVVGSKRITLVSPLETVSVYNTRSVYSDVKVEAPDFDRFPAFRDAHPIVVDVSPGEALFIPVGWWHHVEALEMSVSVSSTSFAYPNTFTWFHPERIE
jgi:ribosomal protein L16 Arg81 hydroxylase